MHAQRPVKSVHIYQCMYLSMYVHMHVCIYMCICACMYQCIHTYMVYACRYVLVKQACMIYMQYVCVYVCRYVQIYVARHVHVYACMCCGSEYKYCRNEYIPSSYGIFTFWWENTFTTPLLMMSLCYITNNIINPCSKLHALGSEVYNTPRFQ